jgi:hypothetical protein
VKGFGHGAKLLAHANRLRSGNAHGHGGLLHIQAEQARTSGGRAHAAGRAGDVPAPVVVVGVHAVAHATRHINAQHQSVDDLAARKMPVLGQCQQGRGHWPGGVDDGFQVGVVKVKGVRGNAVDQRRSPHVHPLAAPEQARLRGRVKGLHGGQCGLHAFMARCANRATDPVEPGAQGFVLDRVAPTARGVAGHMAGQDVGDGGRVVVSADLGVAGHIDPCGGVSL